MRYHTAIITMDGADPRTIGREQVKQVHIIRLPFRLRVGTFFKVTVDVDGRLHIYARNRVDVPRGMQWPANRKLTPAELSELNTDVMVVEDQPVIAESDIEAIRTTADLKAVTVIGSSGRAQVALRNLIIGYAQVDGVGFSGNRLSLPSVRSFYEHMLWHFTVLCASPQPLTDAEALWILSVEASEDANWPFVSLLDDLTPEELGRIPIAFLVAQREFHREMAFLARSSMVGGDQRMALLMAVVALESVHGLFLRDVLVERLSGCMSRRRELIDRLLREQGFYVLNQLTPSLLMDPDERPTEETIKACGLGIQIRNAIMHGGLDPKTGRPKADKYSLKQICDSHRAVLAVYDSYVTALSRRSGAGEAGRQG